MKRLPSHSIKDKAVSLFFRFWKPVASALFWAISITIALSLRSSEQPEAIVYTTVCTVQNEIVKGKSLQKSDVTTMQIPVESMPQNAIADCTQEQMYTLPLQHTLAAGDILQTSAFLDPQSDTGKLLTQLSTSNLKLLYLSPTDVHVYPQRVEKGQLVSFYAKTKNDPEATVLADGIEITDVVIGTDDTGKETLVQFGVLVTQQQALSFTKVFEQKGVIQMALTSNQTTTTNIAPTPTVTPRR